MCVLGDVPHGGEGQAVCDSEVYGCLCICLLIAVQPQAARCSSLGLRGTINWVTRRDGNPHELRQDAATASSPSHNLVPSP